MVRVIGRTNGELEPAVMLSVDTTEDPVEARRKLVKEAALKLHADITGTSMEDVLIFMKGGVLVWPLALKLPVALHMLHHMAACMVL